MLFYTHVNEDNLVENQYLHTGSFQSLFCVAGSGDRLLSLMGKPSVRDVFVIDSNREALFLSELKIKSLQNLAVEDYLSFIGVQKISSGERLKMYRQVAAQLSPDCRQYWEEKQPDLAKRLLDTGLSDYVTEFSSGLKVWHTHKTYQLRIQEIHPLAQAGLSIMSLFKPFLRRTRKGYLLSFASLFAYSYEMLSEINEVLQALEKKGIDFLNVICSKGDPVYQLLKPLSVSEYLYAFVTDFPIPRDKMITVDVRCL